ncbi:hypothetical protein P170DRAFT_370224 [Aspergillus steynii IBT 23096]|uniref:HPP transmembrane region domain-containing protein n=1 Tax=Aspergillus steynii IBT 23096 TaxID=1392250 RepID=A0A2I2FRK5_9EURO|nr:uncharacterized protein P170DRAFT_370224 [Aspergillus steynii IBT 23096]PLB43239.1 hypothetical protein P170DRAFT_370224 [Aspergillus steynii IBT 23096]
MFKHVDFSRWHLDIDDYINPYIPAPPWRYLPRPISHFFGYRGDKVPKSLGNLVIAFWSLIGVFCGVLVVAEVSEHVPSFQHHNGPVIVASFGAAAVLEFAVIESPFAQPRNAVLSQLFASIIGIGIGKLFALNPAAHSKPQVGGALSCAITTAFMVLTNTVHPPAGATALLAVTEGYPIGWFLIPIMVLGCVMMQAVALVVNNIQRRFPVYWWTAVPLSRRRLADAESGGGEKGTHGPSHGHGAESSSDSAVTNTEEAPVRIVIQEGKVLVPDDLWITAEEMEVLERISERIQ